MSNAQAIEQRNNFIIRHSMFDIRYSFREHGKFIILELPIAEELAKHLLNSAESSLEECRYYLIPAPDLGYGQTDRLMTSIEEVCKLLNAYERAILAPGFLLLIKNLSFLQFIIQQVIRLFAADSPLSCDQFKRFVASEAGSLHFCFEVLL
jgi:hypothetical protein